ncbi:unnamed protein product [Linum tenue]|uniref:Uncharacterized protein n=1 Tax=Linum tenue TaxID=586396 RepID=A0AAV0NB44_9ROSI|nr:unnamed protein product [Linum tenue]
MKCNICSRVEEALSVLEGRKNDMISSLGMFICQTWTKSNCWSTSMLTWICMIKRVMMKGVTHGACDYLITSVCIEALKSILHHVVRNARDK